MIKVVQELRRETIEAYVEQLIALLDLLDGDPAFDTRGDIENVASHRKCAGLWR